MFTFVIEQNARFDSIMFDINDWRLWLKDLNKTLQGVVNFRREHF